MDLVYYARLKPLLENVVIRTILFARDEYTCVYCGIQVTFESGTKDHYIPKHYFRQRKLGAAKASTWHNMVTACERCNTFKDNMLPSECGMYPKVYPSIPNVVRVTYPGLATKLVQPQFVAEWVVHNPTTGSWGTSKSAPPT